MVPTSYYVIIYLLGEMNEEFERLFERAIAPDKAQETPQAVRALVNDLAENSPSYILKLLEGTGQTPPRTFRRNLMNDFSNSPSQHSPNTQFTELFERSLSTTSHPPNSSVRILPEQN